MAGAPRRRHRRSAPRSRTMTGPFAPSARPPWAAFPEAGWQIRSFADASPSLQRLIDRVGFFLDLVGVTALLVGGIGIGNAVAGYIASKTAAIATLKCLGAPSRLIFAAYLLQIMALALLGIAAGLLVGGLAPAAAAPALAGLLPVSLRLLRFPPPPVLAAARRLLTLAEVLMGPPPPP